MSSSTIKRYLKAASCKWLALSYLTIRPVRVWDTHTFHLHHCYEQDLFGIACAKLAGWRIQHSRRKGLDWRDHSMGAIFGSGTRVSMLSASSVGCFRNVFESSELSNSQAEVASFWWRKHSLLCISPYPPSISLQIFFLSFFHASWFGG